MWELYFTNQSQKDAKKIKHSGLKSNVESLFDILREDPFKTPPPYKKLIGELSGAYSRRINIQHRLVYQVYVEQKAIKVLRMWSHYE